MRVNTIYPAIQGEGVLTGTPMILIRLQGCNLRCSWCDTKETWDAGGGREKSVASIIKVVKDLTEGQKWILLTGGEPLEQDVIPLTKALRGAGYKIALETNGTRPLRGIFDWVCVSPKGDALPGVCQAANETKIVIENVKDIPQAEYVNICLQPMGGNQKALELCIRVVQERGWRLSVQLHKLLNLP